MATAKTVYLCEDCEKEYDSVADADKCFEGDNADAIKIAELLHSLLCSKSHSKSGNSKSGNCDWARTSWTSDEHGKWLDEAASWLSDDSKTYLDLEPLLSHLLDLKSSI